MNVPAGALDLLAARRMVLALPCGDGALLAALLARSMFAVGLDVDAARVQAWRERRLVAWQGSWRLLAAHRQKFDGMYVDLSALGADLPAAEVGACLALLAQSLLPGGVLLLPIAEDAQPPAPAQLPPGLEPRPGLAGLLVFDRPRAPAPAVAAPAPWIVGPYADVFVGWKRVLEIGAGRGRFLDALHVRDLEGVGIEPDPELAAVARARGHTIHAAFAELHDQAGTFGGVHLGNTVEGLAADDLAPLLLFCRQMLQPHGRLLLRADRSSPVVPRARELAARAGFVACHVGAVPGDLRDCLLLAVADDRVHDLHAALPAELVRLATREPAIDQPLRSLFDLERCERRVCSQGGEDGVLEAIFAHIGTTNRSYVEFGCGDGVQCNTAHLRRQGWHGLLMDGVAAPGAADVVIHAAWVTAENIHALLDAHCVPAEPDLLSIDIDGNDYWVFGAITRRPRVVVVEYNANLGADEALTIPYDPEHRWNGTDFYGASLMALEQLGRSKGYTLVYCTQAGVNAFFVRDDLMGGEPRRSVASVYRPPNYWYRGARQVPDLSRAMVTV